MATNVAAGRHGNEHDPHIALASRKSRIRHAAAVTCFRHFSSLGHIGPAEENVVDTGEKLGAHIGWDITEMKEVFQVGKLRLSVAVLALPLA